MDRLALFSVVMGGLRPDPNVGFLQRIARAVGPKQHPVGDRVKFTASRAIELGESDLVTQRSGADEFQ